MNLLKQILVGYLRHGITIAAGYLLSHGLIDQSGAQILASTALALAGVAWSTAGKLLANYELQAARKALPPCILPPPPVSFVSIP